MKSIFQIPFLICFLPLFSLTANSQTYKSFPEPITQAYFNEDYEKVVLLARACLLPPEKESAARFIRMAYFLSWYNSPDQQLIGMQKVFIDFWKGKYPTPFLLDSVNLSQQADYLTIQSMVSFNHDNLSETDSLLRLSVNIRPLRSLLDSCIQADNLQFLGRIAKTRNDYVSAMGYYTEALRINDKINREQAIAGIYIEQAPAFLKTNPDNESIISNLTWAVDYFKSTQDHQKLSWAYNEIGNYYSTKGKYETAINWFKAIIDIHQTGSLESIHSAYNNISAMYTLLGKNDSIIYYMQKALRAVNPDDFEQKAFYLSNLGAIYGTQNEPDSALSCFKEALQILNNDDPVDDLAFNPDPEQFSSILPIVISNKGNALFELYQNTGNVEQLKLAMKSLAMAIKQFNTIRAYSNEDNRLIFGTDSRDFYFLALRIASEMYRLQPDQSNADQVIRYSQQSKAAVFNDFQRIKKARDNLDLNPTLVHQGDSLRQSISSLNQQYFEARRNPDISNEKASEINSEILRVKQELDELNDMISALYPGYSKYIETPDPASLKAIQATMDGDEFLLDYTYSNNILLIIGIDRNQIKIVKKEITSNFSRDVGEYLTLLNEKTGSEFNRLQELAFSFWQKFLKPFENNLTDKDLVIIPDGIIGYLPFDTFVLDSTPPARKHFHELDLLIDHNATRYLSSLNQLLVKKDERRKPVEVFAFAPFISEPYKDEQMTLSQLSGSRMEVEAISRHARVKAFYDDQATKQIFLEKSQQIDVVHLATHGLLSAGNPMNNRILFNQNSDKPNLALYEVINLPINSELIVLSACETGTGDLQVGEGIMSLTRGFHNAGAASLIMSLWPAYDKPSVEIMDVFYRELIKGEKISHALRAAKLEFLNQSPSNTSHPSYWANYQLSGLDSVIHLKKSKRQQLFYLIPLVILLSLLAFLIRRKVT